MEHLLLHLGALMAPLWQGMPSSEVEHWFQEVVMAVECTGSQVAADRGQHVERLQSIYSAILSSSPPGEPPLCCPPSPLPFQSPSTK